MKGREKTTGFIRTKKQKGGTMAGKASMHARVINVKGRSFLEINGKRVLSPAYTYNAGRNNPKHPKQAVESGIRIIFINTTTKWWSDGRFETDALDRELNLFSDSPKDLALIVRFTITTPEDFAEKYPDELVRFAYVPDEQMSHEEYRGGLLKVLPKFASFASEKWRAAGCRYINRVIDFVEKHPQGHRVIGYMINTGETGEAILWGIQEGLYGDFSQPAIKAFRKWLKKKYGDDYGLQQAYDNKDLKIENVYPPSLETRANATFGELRDPEKDLLAIDYDRFQSNMVVDALIHWHSYARKRIGKDKLLGCFYGYCLWLSGMLNATPAQGHCGLARLLETPEIDFVTGITTYWKRGPGQPGQYMLPVASVALHNKIHWNEDDLRTHLVLSNKNVWATPEAGVPLNEAGSVNIYRRQFCRSLTDNSQTWYYDIVGGMYDSPGILNEFSKQCEIAEKLRDADMSSCAEVACIVSELTPFYHRQYHGTFHQHREIATDILCDRVTEGLYRTGVPVDWYLSSDLTRVDFSQYKVIYFFNLVVATNEERTAIESLKNNGRILIFLWSAGFLTETKASPHFSSQLTGIQMAQVLLRGPAKIKITDFTTPVTRELATIKTIGTELVYSPLLAIEDKNANVFGIYEWNGVPAAAYKCFTNWTSVYIGTSTTEFELLRGIFRYAGCTIRCEVGNVIMENQSVLGVHTRHPGPLVLRLPSECCGLEDLYSGNRFMKNNGFVHLGYAGKGETRIFLKLKEKMSLQKDTHKQRWN